MTNWQTGDVITAEKLNDMQSLIIHYDSTSGLLDRTWQEIYDALVNGRATTVRETDYVDDSMYAVRLMAIISATHFGPDYSIVLFDYVTKSTVEFNASNPTDYPTAEGGGGVQ